MESQCIQNSSLPITIRSRIPMSSCYLIVDICSQRVQTGQPAFEYIAVQSVFQLPGFISHPFCETVRFGDFRREGGAEVHYYHFMHQKKGLALSVSPCNSGPARLIANVYENRRLAKKSRPLHGDFGAIISSFEFSHAVLTSELDDLFVVMSVNCVEFYASEFHLLGSIRVPLVSMASSLVSSDFSSLVDRISNDSSLEPLFVVLDGDCGHTLDCNLQVVIPKGGCPDGERSACQAVLNLELGGRTAISREVVCELL